METWNCQACNGEVAHLGVLGQREHGRCIACGLDQSHLLGLDPEDQILRDEEAASLSPEELADGQAQFEAWFPAPILTRPGESLIDTVKAARAADEEEGEFEAHNNDMK